MTDTYRPLDDPYYDDPEAMSLYLEYIYLASVNTEMWD